MKGSKTKKLFALMVGVALVNIIVLSPGLLGVKLAGGGAFQTATAVTVLLLSVLIVVRGSYNLLFRLPVVKPVRELKTNHDYMLALRRYWQVKSLRKDVDLATDQLRRMDKKKTAVMNVLGQRFMPTELSYTKFATVVYQVEELFYNNIKGVMNKLSVFDESEFAALSNRNHSSSNYASLRNRSSDGASRLAQEKANLYHEYLSYVSGYLEANEEIMLKLDKLILEISLLSSTGQSDVDDLPCMKEIDELIRQTKYYKQ